jgi:hypothetical protein
LGFGGAAQNLRRSRFGGFAASPKQIHLGGISCGGPLRRRRRRTLGLRLGCSRSSGQKPASQGTDFELFEQGAKGVFVSEFAH